MESHRFTNRNFPYWNSVVFVLVYEAHISKNLVNLVELSQMLLLNQGLLNKTNRNTKFQYNDPLKFVRGQHIVQIWFTEPANERGETLSKIWYSFICLIALSTWIQRREICWVSVTSLALNCKDFVLDKNGGIVKLAFLASNKSCIKKPLSAITWSPSLTSDRNPLCLVISLSDILPWYKELINVTVPWGAIPTKNLNVVYHLYVEKISESRTLELGLWTLISVQSRITLVLR